MNRSLFSLFALLAALISVSCANMTQGLLKDPEVNILDFKLTGMTAEDISMDLQLNVSNPNPIPLQLDEVTYSLNFSGETVTAGTFNKGLSIPATGAGKVTVPLKFKFNSVSNLLSGFMNRKLSKEYELSGAAKVGLFSIPFVKKGEVDLAK